MAVGQIGESGAAVVVHVAVELKHGIVLALILPQQAVVLIAEGLASSPNLATRMGAQVRNSLLIVMNYKVYLFTF